MKQNQFRRSLVIQLAKLSKLKILSKNNSPYPINYLYEDILDTLREMEYRPKDSSPMHFNVVGTSLFSPTSISTNVLPSSVEMNPIDMKDMTLKKLWDEVVREFSCDQRVQLIDLTVDGRKQRCVRFLPGNTSLPL